MNAGVDKDRVRQANRTFYDLVAGHYEAIDGRRSPELLAWLTATLVRLRRAAPGGALADIGAGAGLVCRCAAGLFDRRIALDISPAILAAHAAAFDLGLAADVDALPLADASLDAAMAFATLHHLHDFAGLAREMGRVLRPGGVFCSDHDMDQAFHDRFRWPLAVYRRLRDASGRYASRVPGITPELYALSEFHEAGIDAPELAGLFASQGFDTRLEFHWYGLTPATDRVFGQRTFSRGLAPLVRLWAVKKTETAPSRGPRGR